MAPSGVLLQIVSIHEDPVLSILSMPNNTFISGGVDKMICLITNKNKRNEGDDDNDEKAVRYIDHFQNNTITSLIQIDENRFASSSIDGTVKIMDMVKNDLVCTLATIDSKPVYSIAYDHLSNVLYAGEGGGEISKWNISIKESKVEGKQVDTLKGHTKRVLQVKVVHSECIASSSMDKTMRIWNIFTMTEISKIESSSLIRTICKYNDTCFVYGDEDGVITVYNMNKKSVEGIVQGHTGICHQIIQLSQHVNCFCSCGEDKRVVFWNLSSRKQTGEIEDAHFERILSIAQLTNGDIVSSGMDQVMKIWRISY